jgi:hypothetical protein
MEYRIVTVQTVFGEERERRLKLAFDIIWNFDVKKAKVGYARRKNQHANKTGEAPQQDKGHQKDTEGNYNAQRAST